MAVTAKMPKIMTMNRSNLLFMTRLPCLPGNNWGKSNLSKSATLLKRGEALVVMHVECGTRIFLVIRERAAHATLSGAADKTLDCAKRESLSALQSCEVA